MEEVFQRNEDYTKSAFLNWRTSSHADIENFLVLAEGFLLSSVQLSQACIADNSDKKADILIFPILHDANHGIELYLKAMTWTLNRLLRNNKRIEPKNHDIRQLYLNVRSKIKSYKGGDWCNHFDRQNKSLKEYIDELFKLLSENGSMNRNMEFSRFPMNKDYKNHFYIEHLDNIEIDLENLKERLIDIQESLDERASYFFYQELLEEY